MEARPLLSRRPARTCTRRWRANAWPCARRVGLLRRLDARQDRGGRAGRGRVPEPHLHQRLAQARAGPLPLRPDAERGRLHLRRRRRRPAGARPLPRDDDDRRRGARAAAHGGLSADRVAGSRGLADLDHRAVGGHRRAGAARRARCSRRWSRASTSRRQALPHMSVREGTICGVPSRLFRVSFTGELGYEINVPADYGAAVWEALIERGRALRHHALRHRGDARAARREGLHHRRPGDRRHGDAGRCRARLGGRQDEARLRRQALAAAAGHRRAGPQAAGRPADRRIRGRCWRKARRSSPTRRSRCRCGCSATSPRATGAPAAAARSRWRWSPAGGRGSASGCM